MHQTEKKTAPGRKPACRARVIATTSNRRIRTSIAGGIALELLAPSTGDGADDGRENHRGRGAVASNGSFLAADADPGHRYQGPRRMWQFSGPEIPRPSPAMDPERGEAERPRHEHPERGVRALSGADGWMFDGEDALSQISTMSLDNQEPEAGLRGRPQFLDVAAEVATEMNRWAGDFSEGDHPRLSGTLSFTTKIFRARGLHLDDQHIRTGDGDRSRHPSPTSPSSSIISASCRRPVRPSFSICRKSRRPKKRSGTTC